MLVTDTVSDSLPGLTTLFHLMKSFRGREYPLRDAFFHYLLSGIIGRDIIASYLKEDASLWENFQDVEKQDIIMASRLRYVAIHLDAENLEDLFVRIEHDKHFALRSPFLLNALSIHYQ